MEGEDKMEKLEFVKVLVVGEPGVGKSSLVMHFLVEEYAAQWQDSFSEDSDVAFASPKVSTNTSTSFSSPKHSRISSISAAEELSNIVRSGSLFYASGLGDDDDEIVNNDVISKYSRRFSKFTKYSSSSVLKSPRSKDTGDNEMVLQASTSVDSSETLLRREESESNPHGRQLSSSLPSLRSLALDKIETPTNSSPALKRVLSDTDFERKKLLKLEIAQAVTLFNNKPQKGIDYLIQANIISDTPEDKALFLASAPGIDNTVVGDYLGGKEPESKELRLAYMRRLDFTNKTFEDAFRYLISQIRLPGEGQKIERIMETFGEILVEQTGGTLPDQEFPIDADQAFGMVFVLLMLHTSIYNKTIKKQGVKINKNSFFNQLQDCSKAITRRFANRVYENILSAEIKGAPIVKLYEDSHSDCVFKYLRIDSKLVQVKIVDDIFPPGQIYFHGMRDAFLKQGDGFVLVFDVTNRDSFTGLASYRRDILRSKDLETFPMVLVGSKADAVEDRQVSTEEGEKLASAWGIDYYEVSNISQEQRTDTHQKIVKNLARRVKEFKESNSGQGNCKLM